MDLGLRGRSALVIGGSRGIGFAVARSLGLEGVRVTIAARDAAGLEAAAGELKDAGVETVHTVVMDISKVETVKPAVEEAARKNGALDILVTNSGGPPTGPVQDADESAWRDALDGVLTGAIAAINAAVPYLKRSEGGAIACINSYIYRQPPANRGLSSVPRAGLAALVKTLALELGPLGIRVNNICPGPVMTDRARELLSELAQRNSSDVETEKQKLIAANLAVQRYGEPEDVGDLIAFVVSQRAGFITGATLPVDGGMVRALV